MLLALVDMTQGRLLGDCNAHHELALLTLWPDQPLLLLYVQELESDILPALAAAPNLQLRTNHDLAKQYRRSAAAAPTRPHGWFLGAPDTSTAAVAEGEGGSGDGGSGVRGAAAAAVAATKEALRRVVAAPVRAGVAAVDAAADMARFGPGNVPEKL
jgi:hypothetical protein